MRVGRSGIAGADDGLTVAGAKWEREFDAWLAPLWDALGDARRRRWAPLYVHGLVGSSERKSVGPVAAAVAPGDYARVHHFVNASTWDNGPLERVLAEKAEALVGTPNTVLIVDDTALLKQGRRSVRVARQYAGAAGNKANCHALVSLTLAWGEVPVSVALPQFLPEEWTRDPARCRAAGVPDVRLPPRTKGELAVDEIDRVVAAGLRFGCRLADAGYGASADFRRALTACGLT